MDDFIERSPTERVKRERGDKVLNRLPTVVWSRLYHDLKPYLTERQADQTVLLAFYHRQIAEAGARRHLRGDEKVRTHRGLATYFGKQESWLGPDRATAAPNRRKASELVSQQLLAGMWDAVAATLAGEEALPFLEARAAAGQVFDLADDYAN